MPWFENQQPSAGHAERKIRAVEEDIQEVTQAVEGISAVQDEEDVKLIAREIRFSRLSSARGFKMPQYNFFCKVCQKPFTKTLSLAEYEKGKIACPACNSKDVEQRWAAFYAVTSKKS